MPTKTTPQMLRKPQLAAATISAFAEGSMSDQKRQGEGQVPEPMKNASKERKSGLVPEGDVRLTANIKAALHMKLKLRAVQQRTTVGELIEKWIESFDA